MSGSRVELAHACGAVYGESGVRTTTRAGAKDNDDVRHVRLPRT
ncbi:hypothetical protein P3T23_000420 [Paraburkholderia sp. GAS448]